MSIRTVARALSGATIALVIAGPAAAEPPNAPSSSSTEKRASVVKRARVEVKRKVRYDGAYRSLTYTKERDTGKFVFPGGDVDPRVGVCTDVVIRGYRAAGVDFQLLISQDIGRAKSAYPRVDRHDRNIDHRRVPNLLAYLRRHADRVPITDSVQSASNARPGDVVVWSIKPCPSCYPDHIGVLSDRVGKSGWPLVIHNLGPVPTEDDVLKRWTVLGVFRVLRGDGARGPSA